MSQLNRRRFMQTAGALGAAFGFGGANSFGWTRSANETIRVAVAGLNGRGESHVGELNEIPGVQITYLVDPDTRTHERRAQAVEAKTGVRPKLVQDIRYALEDPNVDAITIATPNHWHSLMTIWACQAEKDVYVEKPCSHNIFEGRVAVEAARKYNRIVQHGTQNRSNSAKANVAAVIKSGKLGKLLVSRGLCYKKRDSIGIKTPETPPSELDFNLWVGPATMQQFHPNLVHYNWHWFWDFGNGDIGNQGVHEMDIARWNIPNATWPKSVFSFGGRFGYEDQGQTANTQVAIFDYGETKLIFEVRGRPCQGYHDQSVGNVFHLESGIIAGTTYFPHDGKGPAPLPELPSDRGPGNSHFVNFIEAVRSRETKHLNADILEGHYSSGLCHLANASYRIGSTKSFEELDQLLDGHKAAIETCTRMKEHLNKDVGLDLSMNKVQVGTHLAFDSATETILDNPVAQSLLTRDYRDGFVVPKSIA